MEEDQSECVLRCICNVRYKLQRANEFATDNPKTAQSRMKAWYDQRARKQVFSLRLRVICRRRQLTNT